jgi:GT2 family glycosyltransferase
MKKNTKVAVAIVNWNSKNYLKNCLDSLIKYNTNFINKIIVVDNNSSDNSMNIIPNHKLIKIITTTTTTTTT